MVPPGWGLAFRVGQPPKDGDDPVEQRAGRRCLGLSDVISCDPMTRQSIWLSYDLGVEGDYEGLYEWLAKHDARECGDSVAWFEYRYRASLVPELRAELTKEVTVGRRTRFYAIYSEDGRIRGKFILGGRRRAPWEGYSTDDDEGEDLPEAIIRKFAKKSSGR
jgi:hypothetical protein